MKHDRQDSGGVPRCSAVDDIGLMVVVAQATDATHAAGEFRRHRPDITLMDFRLPDASGTDALLSIRSEFPEARILMLTTSDNAEIQRASRGRRFTSQSPGF